jgi:hypothetical protein
MVKVVMSVDFICRASYDRRNDEYELQKKLFPYFGVPEFGDNTIVSNITQNFSK